MKILDRYIIKQFLQTVFFGLLAFTLLFVIIDMMENLDDFIDHNVPFKIIMQYYLVFIPDIIKLMTPVAVLFAGLFTAGKMSNQNEITAIKAGGISIYRFMLPVVVVCVFISIGSIYFGGYVVPKANKTKTRIENEFLRRNMLQPGNNIFFQDSKTKIVNINFFDDSQNEGVGASIQQFDSKDITKVILRIDAERIRFDEVRNKWIAINCTRREFQEISEKVDFYQTLVIDSLNFRPKDVLLKQQRLEILSNDELSQLIDDVSKSGHDPRRIVIEYYNRFSFAFTSFIIILFGLPYSANKRKAGIALQFGINILITFVYLGMSEIIKAFGKNGVMNPFLTAWLVNMLFATGAIINLIRARK